MSPGLMGAPPKPLQSGGLGCISQWMDSPHPQVLNGRKWLPWKLFGGVWDGVIMSLPNHFGISSITSSEYSTGSDARHGEAPGSGCAHCQYDQYHCQYAQIVVSLWGALPLLLIFRKLAKQFSLCFMFYFIYLFALRQNKYFSFAPCS